MLKGFRELHGAGESGFAPAAIQRLLEREEVDDALVSAAAVSCLV